MGKNLNLFQARTFKKFFSKNKMKEEQSNLVKQLNKGGYPVISRFVTLKGIPIARIEEDEIIYPETISPPSVVKEKWGNKEKSMNNFTSYLRQINAKYRDNGHIVEGEKRIPWEDYKKEKRLFY